MEYVNQLWSQVSSGTAWVWLTNDAMGQRLGLGLILLTAVLGLFLVARFGKTVAKKCGHLSKLLLLVAGSYYAAVLLLKLDPAQWAPAAAVAGLAVLVAGLALAARKQQGKGGSPKAKPA